MEKIKKYLFFFLFLLPFVLIAYVWRKTIFGNAVSSNGDVLFAFYPYFEHFAHQGPLVTQHILSGFPVFVSVASMGLYPLNHLATSFFDPLNAYKILNISGIILTYLCTYLYARKITFNKLIPIFIALIFTFSGQLMLWGDTLTNTNYYFLLPLALYLLESSRQATHLRYYTHLFILGAILGIGWLSGHVQYVVYIHILVAIYALFFNIIDKDIWRAYIKTALDLFLVYLVSFLIGFPQILAILHFRSETVRSTGVRVSDFFIGAYQPQDLIHYLLPFWKSSVIPVSSPNLYLGILPFILLVFGWLLRKHISQPRFSFYAGVFVFCFLSSIYYSPLGFLLHHLPLFNSFREAPRVMFIGNFAAACLIGFILDKLIHSQEELWPLWNRYLVILKKIFLYVFLPIIIFTSLLRLFFFEHIQTFLNTYFINHLYARTAQLPKEYYFNVIKNQLDELLGQFSFTHPHILIFIFFFSLSVWILSRSRKMPKEYALTLCITLTTVNLGAVYGNYYQTISRQEVEAIPATVKFIQEREKDSTQPFRVFTIFPGQTIFQELGVRCQNGSPEENVALQKELLLPNINMLYGLDVINGYDNFMPRNISTMLAYVGSEQAVTGDLLANKKVPIEERIQEMVRRKNLLRAMNTKYIISHHQISDTDFKEVFSTEVGSCATRVHIYELTDTWPRYFVSTSMTEVAAENEQGLFKKIVLDIQDNGDTPKILVHTNKTNDFSFQNAASSIASVVPQLTQDSMIFETNGQTTSTLFIGNTWLPDWNATINGEKVEILKANYLYMAIVAPPGKQRIILSYKHPHLWWKW